jgi:Orsellinic acid/F9775 biosynthesis cluster protein D
MEPFIKLPSYPFIVCRECQYAVLPSQIDSHLKNKKKHGWEKERRDRVIAEVGRVHGLILTERQLEAYEFPPGPVRAIPELKSPRNDGSKCKSCPYVICHRRLIQEHSRTVHDWENGRKKGRLSYKKRKEELVLPWIPNVRCQQLFKQGIKSAFFEVAADDSATETVESDIWTKGKKVTTERREHMEKKVKESIREEDEGKEPNPWVMRVGWIKGLARKNPEKLKESIEPADAKEEPILHAIIESFRRVVDKAQQKGVRNVVGISALFEVNKKIATIKPKMPFSSYMGEDTKPKYRGYWEQVLCFMYRTSELAKFEEDKPGYQLTRDQEAAFDDLIEAIEGLTEQEDESSHHVNAKSPEEIDIELDKVDRLCLQLVMTLLDHQFGDDEYASVVISGLAVLGIREDGGWLNAEDYTTKYSGIIKIARMLVLYRSYVEREDAVAARQRTMTEAKARARTEPIFDIVQRRVRRYMTLVSEWSKPSPMDWIYECRTYGMKIRYNTTAEGAMEWEGSKVMYQKIRFDMKQLQGMVAGLVEEARRALMELLMIEMNEEGEVKGNILPPIDWAKLSDDPSEERVGWSFLMDAHNQLGVDGKWWLLKRVSHEAKLTQEWIREEGNRDHPYRLETAAIYQQKVEAF